jgi:hypothetical protein
MLFTAQNSRPKPALRTTQCGCLSAAFASGGRGVALATNAQQEDAECATVASARETAWSQTGFVLIIALEGGN